MSVYSTAVDAYRDTTKWLVTFAPITAALTAATLVGPRLVRSAQAAPSAAAWGADNWGVLLAGVALLGAVAAVLASGARVLSVEPTDIATQAASRRGASDLATAVGAGVTTPEFFTKESYVEAMTQQAHAWDQPTRVAADVERLERLRTATEALRDWSLFNGIQKPFSDFRRVFVVSSAVLVAALVYIPFALGPSTPIGEPAEVAVSLSAAGAQDLRSTTGCTDPGSSEYLAVGGTWQQPVLAVDGPGCRFGATWQPTTDQAELRLP
ncbi:hypothetical protein [Aquipuribacter sp. MA13-6]|uniref:hypothetical protein n=1 Tax=unclassified Aquipuribacter TaxID=2635084 RepID=UPI003EECAD6C